MKRVLILLVITAMSQLGFTQEKQPAESNVTEESSTGRKVHGKKNWREKRKMMGQLNLTDDQKSKLAAVRMADKEKRQAILNDRSLSEDQKKTQLKENKKGHLKDFQNILNDEQKEKMKTMRQQQKVKGSHRKDRLNKIEQPEKIIDSTTNQ